MRISTRVASKRGVQVPTKRSAKGRHQVVMNSAYVPKMYFLHSGWQFYHRLVMCPGSARVKITLQPRSLSRSVSFLGLLILRCGAAGSLCGCGRVFPQGSGSADEHERLKLLRCGTTRCRLWSAPPKACVWLLEEGMKYTITRERFVWACSYAHQSVLARNLWPVWFNNHFRSDYIML